MLKLAIEIDAEAPLEYEVRGDKTTIGRSHDNDFRIKNSYVSAFHAEVVRLPSGEFEIVDLGSFNGTFVNGSRVERAVIAPGDRVSIGTLKGRVLEPGANGHATVSKKEKSGPVIAPLKARTPADSAPVNGSSRKSHTGPRTPAAGRKPAAGASPSPDPADLENRIAVAEKERAHLAKALEASQAAAKQMEAEVSALRAQVAASHSAAPDEVKRLQAEIAALTKKEAGWQRQIQEGEAAAQRLATAESDLADARTFILQEQQALADLRSQLSEASSKPAGQPEAETRLRSDLDASTKRAEKAETGIKALSDQLAKLTATNGRLSQEANDLKDRLAGQEMAARGASEIHSREASDTNTRLITAENDLAAVRQSMGRLEAELTTRDETIAALESQLQDSSAQLRELLSSKGRTEEEADVKIAQLHTRIGELKRENETALAESKRHRAEAEEAKQAQSKLALAESMAVRNLAEARLEGSETLNRLEELQGRFENTEAARDKAEADLTEARERLKSLEARLSEGDAETGRQVVERDATIGDLTARMAALQHRSEDAEASRDKAEADLAEARSRIGELKKRQTADEAEHSRKLAEREQNAAEAARRADEIRNEWEKSRALAAELEAALAESRHQADEWAKHAGELEKARADFETELTASRQLSRKMEAQLADRDARIAADQSAHERAQQEAAARIAEIQSQWEAATERVAHLESELKNHAAAIADVSDDHAAVTRRLAEMQAEWDQATAARHLAESALATAREEAASVSAERDRIRADFEQLSTEVGDLDRITKEKAALKSSLSKLEKEKQTADADALTHQRELLERQDAASSRLADLQAQIAKASRRLDDLKVETRDLESRSEASRDQLAALESLLKERRTELSRTPPGSGQPSGENGPGLGGLLGNLSSRLASLTPGRPTDPDEAPLQGTPAFDIARQIQEKEAEIAKAEQKLQRKLYELKLAEDRIQLAADLDAEIVEKQARADGLSREISTISESIARMEEKRQAGSTELTRLREKLGDSPAPLVGSAPDASVREEVRQLETLQEKIAEYEGYQRILRDSLRLDHATVQIFSQQLIHKLDHIEDMIGAYLGRGDQDTVTQLEALRESFLDLLRDNSVRTYSFDPGTELSVDHRRMIRIVETRQTGVSAGPTRVFATVRPGYVCADIDDGSERILRKAEVITHG